ncbi:hypothetical protein ACOSQ4_001144 [Xanthoceras sorbifolium]
MSNEYEYDDYCETSALSGPTNPGDESRTYVAFSISIHVSFIYPPQLGSTEEDEVGIDELVETEGEDRVFVVERDRLINEENEQKSWSTIRGMLFSVDVFDRSFMVDKILGRARFMASDKLETEEDDMETGLGPASEASIQELEIVRVEEQSTLVEQCGISLEEFSYCFEARRCLVHIFSMNQLKILVHYAGFAFEPRSLGSIANPIHLGSKII